MIKSIAAVVLFGLLLSNLPTSGSAGVLGGNLLAPITSILNLITYFAQPNSPNSVVQCVFGTAATGLTVPIQTQPGVLNNQGALSLATYTLCPQKTTYHLESCTICNMDCMVTHNLYGGSCGQNPLKNISSPTCLCAETQAEADARNLTADSNTSCGDPLPAPLSGLKTFATALAFYVRGRVLQCTQPWNNGTFDSTGCQVDCVNNHGYSGGYCAVEAPNTLTAAFFSGGKNNTFCHCSNEPAHAPTFCGGNTQAINSEGPSVNTYDLYLANSLVNTAMTA